MNPGTLQRINGITTANSKPQTANRAFVFMVFFVLHLPVSAENLHVQMTDLHQFERSQYSPARTAEIIDAFRHCSDAGLKKLFLESDYFDDRAANGLGTYVTGDSARWELRCKNTCYMDVDGDGQKELFFHEKDLQRTLQLAVMLKKQDRQWNVVFREYGVYSGLLMQNRVLMGITIIEFHQFDNPCNIFKLYDAKAAAGKTDIVPRMKVDVPYNYHSPVQLEPVQRTVRILTDSLFFYEAALYNATGYPYLTRVQPQLQQYKHFNTHESEWYSLVPETIYWVGLVQNRGTFSSILVAYNGSYATTFPEYLFLYVPNKYIDL